MDNLQTIIRFLVFLFKKTDVPINLVTGPAKGTKSERDSAKEKRWTFTIEELRSDPMFIDELMLYNRRCNIFLEMHPRMANEGLPHCFDWFFLEIFYPWLSNAHEFLDESSDVPSMRISTSTSIVGIWRSLTPVPISNWRRIQEIGRRKVALAPETDWPHPRMPLPGLNDVTVNGDTYSYQLITIDELFWYRKYSVDEMLDIFE